MRTKQPPRSIASSKPRFDACRASYLDDTKRVIQVFVPWQGRERRHGGERRQTMDRRERVRFEPMMPSGKAPGENRSNVDRRESARLHDAYRIAKFERHR